MEFMEKIGNAISSTGREISDGAKGYKELVSYNTQIFGYQEQIDQTTDEIGKLYVEAHLDDEGAEFKEKLDVIRNAKAKIAELEAMIEEVKSRETCPKCGAAVGPNDAFCVNCGINLAKLREQAADKGGSSPANKIFCTHCGAPNDSDSRFCVQCGKQLITTRPVYVAAPGEEEAAEPGIVLQSEPKLEMAGTPDLEPAPAPELVYQATEEDISQPAPELVYQATEGFTAPELTADPIVTPKFEEPEIELPKVEEVDWKDAMAQRDPDVPAPDLTPAEVPDAPEASAEGPDAPDEEAAAPAAEAAAVEEAAAAEPAAPEEAPPAPAEEPSAPDEAPQAPAEESAPSEGPAPEEPKPVLEPGVWFCTECGHKNQDGYLFCTQCGKKKV